MSVDWGAVWLFVWPILKQAIIAFLMAVLALLGYDREVLPGRVLEGLKAMGFKVESADRRQHAVAADSGRGKHG